MECIEYVSSFSRSLKPGVHVIRVLQLKEEVGHGSRDPFIFRQVTKFGILVRIEQTQLKHQKAFKVLKAFTFVAPYLVFL